MTATAHLDGVEPGVGGDFELVVLAHGVVLVPLALQPVQVRVDHPAKSFSNNIQRVVELMHEFLYETQSMLRDGWYYWMLCEHVPNGII